MLFIHGYTYAQNGFMIISLVVYRLIPRIKLGNYCRLWWYIHGRWI